MSKKYKVVHDRQNCIGCAMCAQLCPQSWKIREEDGLASLEGADKKGDLHVGEIHESDLEDNLNAEASCPVNVIKVESE